MVLFNHDVKGQETARGGLWASGVRKTEALSVTDTTILEQHLLLRMLDRNAKRIPPSLTCEREATEDAFIFSFLLPIGPLSGRAREAMTVDAPDTCAVCGEPTTKMCSGCHAIRYCSPGKYITDETRYRFKCLIHQVFHRGVLDLIDQ